MGFKAEKEDQGEAEGGPEHVEPPESIFRTLNFIGGFEQREGIRLDFRLNMFARVEVMDAMTEPRTEGCLSPCARCGWPRPTSSGNLSSGSGIAVKATEIKINLD